MKKSADNCCAGNPVDRLVSAVKAQPVHARPGSPLRFAVQMDDKAVLDFFACAAGTCGFYFSGREGRFEAAGAGAAQVLSDQTHPDAKSALDAIDTSLKNAPEGLRYYGAMAFDAADPRVADSDLGAFRFVLPEFELVRAGDTTVLAFNTIAEPGDDRDAVKARLHAAFDRTGGSPRVGMLDRGGALRLVSRCDIPREDIWKRQVAGELNNIRSGGLEKIVLARMSRIALAETVDPALLLRRIVSSSVQTYNLCFRFGPTAFLASTPECLYRRVGQRLYTEAIAGTCPRGRTDQQTRDLKDELMDSAKEAEEHRYVYENIDSELRRICRDVCVSAEKDVVELSHVQHFCSRFEGSLKPGVSTADILGALHPTAAVNGFPKDAALERIRRVEPFCRQWYAGPAGWISRRSSEFAVAIRSALVHGKDLTLFAGAGIVGESDPAAEWAETEQKMRQFMEVLD